MLQSDGVHHVTDLYSHLGLCYWIGLYLTYIVIIISVQLRLTDFGYYHDASRQCDKQPSEAAEVCKRRAVARVQRGARLFRCRVLATKGIPAAIATEQVLSPFHTEINSGY